MFKNLDLTIGQAYRKATHVKRFYDAVKNPRAYQTQKLLEIVRANERTKFGIANGFDKVHSYEDFKRFVAPTKYEELEPYVNALRMGEKNQLTAQDPFMFATTSGTTATPKYVPITPKHLSDYTHAFQIHNYHMIQDYPRAAQGKFLIIVSNDQEGLTPCGIPYGAVSGLLNRRQSPIIKRHFAIPYETCKLKDVDLKYYLMLRSSIIKDVTAIVGCNPSSFLLLADQLREHSELLIKDVFDGTISSDYAPPAALAHAFRASQKRDPERARHLQRLLDRDGMLLPKTVWPNISVLCCWKGGPMSFYLERLPESFGDAPIRDFGYMASEGRGSIPIADEGAGGVLALTSHFFEFVDEEQIESTNPTFLMADELKVGGRYYIFFTTNAGFYRYNINDLVEVVGLEGNTPVIKFVRKGLGVSSVTGEKITEEQVLVALTHSVRQLSLQEICHFTAEVQLGFPPHYVCFVELSAQLPESVKNQFLRLFDQSLRRQNPEYEDKRASRRLGMPEMRIVPGGTYIRLRQQRVSEGAPEAQVKIPLLSSPNSFSGRLAMLEVT